MNKKLQVALTDIQLRETNAGGQRVVKTLAMDLHKYYKIIHIGYPISVSKVSEVYPYKNKTKKLKRSSLLKSALIKRLIKYLFHRINILSNGFFIRNNVYADIVISNSNHDDLILLNNSKFHLDYKAGIFINHDPYFKFGKLYPDRLIKDKPFKIIALNSIDYKNLIQKYGKANVSLIHNGIEIKNKNFDIKKRLRALKHKQRLIVSIGRLNETQKKLSIAIKALRKLIKLDKNILFVIAGTGDAANLYTKLISKYNLKNNVKLLGFITQKEKEKLLTSADLVLQPSAKEAFSIATLEALAYGNIVLTTENNGSADIIKDKKNGFLTDLSEEAIGKNIMQILNLSKNKKYSIQKNAFYSARKFSTEKMLSAYHKVITELKNRIKLSAPTKNMPTL
jgi:glycosyltransferase involved in cell wall biosynthesis